MTLFTEECPGHGYITEEGEGDVVECDGACLGTTPIPNAVHAAHDKEWDTMPAETPDTPAHGNYGQPVPDFPAHLGGRMVIHYQRVRSRQGEPTHLAVALLRNPGRPDDVAYEVCNAALRYGAWCRSDPSPDMTASAASVVYQERINERGAAETPAS